MLQRKNQDRDEEQRRDELHDAPGDEIQHGGGTNSLGGMMGGGRHLRDAFSVAEEGAAEVLGAAMLISASTRSRAPVRPASACNPQACWCERSTACGDRDKSAVRH